MSPGADGADGAVAQVIIEDEGPGIPPELLCRVFEPFFRVDPGRRQNIAGAGLGLTIAREIVQRAGGEIRISNRNGGGLKQVVELAKVEEQRGRKGRSRLERRTSPPNDAICTPSASS